MPDEQKNTTKRVDPIDMKPVCDYCHEDADIKITFFVGPLPDGAPTNTCYRCLEKSARLADHLSRATTVRLESWLTGRHSTGNPKNLAALLDMLKPTGGFRTITAAIRITSNGATSSGLHCSVCREPITPTAPGIVRWARHQDGTCHSLRLFHAECVTDPAGQGQEGETWQDLDHIPQLDRSQFSTAARELLDHVERVWAELNRGT
ncbi:MAG: hypothetical protein J7M25_03655 [Deltaproteobacteria bacterium]|nr:hypothetical protein [Deltaproteobacteria bacterium]